MLRLVALAALCLLAPGCSSADKEAGDAPSNQTSPATAEASNSHSMPSSNPTAEADACELLSSKELAALAGERVGPAQPDLVGGLPVCKWPTVGGFVQVGSLPAQDWAQGLPDLLRTLEEAGIAKHSDDMRQLQQIRDLIESGQAMTPTEACAAFSKMLEVQGQPAGTPLIVNVFPSNEDPQAMTGQMCSAGRFTTVTLAKDGGLAPPLPGEQVVRALRLAHRRSFG